MFKSFKNNKVLTIVSKQRANIFVLALSYFINSISVLLLPYLMSQMVSSIENFDESKIYMNAILMAISSIVILISAFFNQKISSTLSTKIVAELQKSIFTKANSLSFSEFSSIGTSSLLTRTTEDASLIREVAGEIVYVFIAVPTMFLGGVIMSFLSDWILALIVLAFCPLVLIATRLITKGIWKIWDEAEILTDEQNRIIRERLSGVRVVRAFNRDEHEHTRAEIATLKMNRHYFKGNTRGGLVTPIATLILNVATVLIVYISKLRVETASFEAENLIAIVQYIAFIVNAIIMLSWTMVFLPHVKVAMTRMNAVLDLPECNEGEDTGEMLSGDVELKNLSFVYEGASRNTLNKINLSAKAGQTVAIIGGTGCGKSAITKIMMAFYKPIEGDILIGGKSYFDLTTTTIRQNLSVALQTPTIFEGTIKENVLMGKPTANDEEVEKVCKIAQIHEFIMSHSEGYDYPLKHSGTNLSGGQKQRISIARTLLKDASVYIFDDSFSALDFLTEKKLRTELKNYLKGKTQIIITQRVSTAMKCDKIYCMDKGEIIGSGSHEDLLQTCQVYKEIADSQLGGVSV